MVHSSMNPGELGPSSTFTMHSDSVDQNTAQIHGQAAASLGLDLQAHACPATVGP